MMDMQPVCLLAFRWLLACAGCLAASALIWLLLNAASRWWPALRTSRNLWLAAQCAAAAVAVLPFLPHIQHAATPHISLETPMPSAAWPDAQQLPVATDRAPRTTVGGSAANAGHPAAAPADAPASDRALSGLITLAAVSWLLVYAAGLAWRIARLRRTRKLWRAMLAAAHPLSPFALHAHAAFTPSQRQQIATRRLTVMRIDAAMSPMLMGVRKPVLLLPSRLDTLSLEQQQMIVAHELHHLRANDPLCLAFASVMQTIFWFAPTLRLMARQMEWALELRCDQHVLAGRPQHQRKQYAASLLQQWTALPPAAAFGGATIADRLRHMQQASLPALSASAACTAGAMLAAVLAVAAALQPALAFSEPDATAAMPDEPAHAATADALAAPWRAPLERMRVTSFFGTRRDILATPHKGIDLGAKKGTPVHATAAGTVIAAGQIAENDGRYGITVIIDHGAQRSLYAHLSSASVTPGQHVDAGQQIGKVGATGFATGPHLHLEVRRPDGQLVDPATLLANLDAHATSRALEVRHRQQPTKG